MPQSFRSNRCCHESKRSPYHHPPVIVEARRCPLVEKFLNLSLTRAWLECGCLLIRFQHDSLTHGAYAAKTLAQDNHFTSSNARLDQS